MEPTSSRIRLLVRQDQLRYADQREASSGSYPMWGQLRHVNNWEKSSQLKEYFIRVIPSPHLVGPSHRYAKTSSGTPKASSGRHPMRGHLRHVNLWEESSQIERVFYQCHMEPTSSRVSQGHQDHTANERPVRIKYKCLVPWIPRNETVMSKTEFRFK